MCTQFFVRVLEADSTCNSKYTCIPQGSASRQKYCVHIPLHTAATIIRGGLSAAYLSCVFTLTCGTFNIGN